MLTLRGHHLICLQFFSGEGYDEAFVRNLKDVLQRAENEDVEVCDGVDDVCGKCSYIKDNKCQYNEDADEKIKEMDEMALKILRIEQGVKIRWQDVKEKIPAIFPQWYSNYCYECDWLGVCEKNEFYQGLIKTH